MMGYYKREEAELLLVKRRRQLMQMAPIKSWPVSIYFMFPFYGLLSQLKNMFFLCSILAYAKVAAMFR